MPSSGRFAFLRLHAHYLTNLLFFVTIALKQSLKWSGVMSGSLGYSVLAIPAGVSLPIGTIATPPPANPALASFSAPQVDRPLFVSPAYQFDPQAGVLVLQLRNSSTGAVTEQIPSQAQLEQYRYSGAPNVGALVAHAVA